LAFFSIILSNNNGIADINTQLIFFPFWGKPYYNILCEQTQSGEFSAMHCSPITYILDVQIYREKKWKGIQKAEVV